MNPMRFTLLLVFAILSVAASLAPRPNFKAEQLSYSRVEAAIEEKQDYLQELCEAKGLQYPPQQIFIRAFKLEQQLEVWIKQDEQYVLFKQYAICKLSGQLGPKRQQGDLQTPEGFYYIDRFNPVSNFHLSLGINYPNEADQILGVKGKLGGDIFIHGDCQTIGCLPMTDDKMKEIYLLTMEAHEAGQEDIPVHIFPARLSDANMLTLKQAATGKQQLIAFWKKLKVGYDYFEKYGELPTVAVLNDGSYAITAWQQ